MNREIKFRGRLKSSKNWHYGYVLFNHDRTKAQIMQPLVLDNMYFPIQTFNVDIETIGQFTGLYDKNGKEIYEGDIVLQQGYHGNKIPMLVRFENGAFIVGYHDGSSTRRRPMLLNNKCEVIGNIYDNKDLLEG